ncbi:RNA 3'-phosphate cyclase [Geoglobus ahangari]|uniref:RNA 3'-terminal phosphate cyclase n=1 Tax=Geoglobus ahangari TaxID=113653 RepID=A0A0F7IFB3_9EURY|nr:RNA 3'-terminal phosphate cyclase [Geoglobus ahangari]AKG91759.1 RNA 3'-phosphate cyclase [Geoglobus ahangari]
MIRVDGSYGEGGGQILRSAIALSCVTGEAVEIYNIRANRPKPGLKAQHMKGIEAAKLLCNAEVEGLRPGSTRVIFRPGEVRVRDLRIDIGTAGSITLLLQTILPPLLHAGKECRLEITGGTDVSWSPSIDYFRFVTSSALRELGADLDIDVIRRGYYPKGRGKVVVHIRESELEGRRFEEVRCEAVRGVSHCSNLPAHVAERQARAARRLLESSNYRAEIETEVRRDYSTGSGITIYCGYKGTVSLGEKGKRAEKVGEEAALELLRELGMSGAFDRHLADQVMIAGAIARGTTEYTTTEVTMHTRSNAYVINSFFPDSVEIDGNRLRIRGTRD